MLFTVQRRRPTRWDCDGETPTAVVAAAAARAKPARTGGSGGGGSGGDSGDGDDDDGVTPAGERDACDIPRRRRTPDD